MGLVGVSSGTAAALGLKKTKNDTLPETAYLLIGSGCSNNCSFCPQGTLGESQRNFLSRITWPRFEWEVVYPELIRAAREGIIKKACFQVTDSPGNLEELVEYGTPLIEAGVAVNTSCVFEDVDTARRLFKIGFERISLALDCASPEHFEKIKGREWDRTWDDLEKLNSTFPGRVATHLIVGLGETQEEMLNILQDLLWKKITVGLFAFTPIKGTPLANHSPPEIDYYRKVQAARHLFMEGKSTIENLVFREGDLVDWGVSRQTLVGFLSPCFYETAGCNNCNRPYYNERPGGEIYNYPRQLSLEEYRKAIEKTLINTKQEGTPDEEKILATYNPGTI